ncbi:uncharacterized protein LOC129807785 [Phlebotomus papatasi]|uniref:uncharacterized protein LOC129807785 n=1 Tax=Phlebotomus papatasi TaxID=29031 RepID=UPI002483B621|nr:uncharacterized protein LOC129807785 [Phlebotomus papatasi]
MSQLSVPSMSSPRLPNFSGVYPDGYEIKIIVDPDRYEILPIRVYNILQVVSGNDLGITVEDYTRMWRTLLLKRLQDIYEYTYYVRPDHYIRISNIVPVPIPAPLGDMLTLIGQYIIPSNGITLQPVPPSRASPAQDWWTVEPAVLDAWLRIHYNLKNHYMMRDFPSPCDVKDKPILALSRGIGSDIVHITAATDKFSSVDAYVRLVHDNLWTLPKEIAAHNNVICGVCPDDFIGSYIGGYRKSFYYL